MRRLSSRFWKVFLWRLYERTGESDITNRSAQAAFYFTFALFPFLFFLISLFGLVLVSAEGLKAETYAYLGQIMPGSAFALVIRTVDEVVSNSTTGKLTIGLIITLWSASAGVDGIRGGLNAVYDLPETRSWWWTKLQSVVITLAVTIIAAAVLGIVFYGWQLVQAGLSKLGLPVDSPWILVGIQWVSILLLMLFAFELIYNILPNFKKPKWDWITPGSLIAIVLWLILSGLFRTYIAYFNSYDKTYGSLGAVMILALWLYLTAFVIMIGGAINSVNRDLRPNRS